ncbi:MAG: hypothetical protein M1138_06380 [Candidatus Thermoplasmatota archaeon]|nr:hypothetical protein [Candidatus Thermoplasmatota archaeon]
MFNRKYKKMVKEAKMQAMAKEEAEKQLQLEKAQAEVQADDELSHAGDVNADAVRNYMSIRSVIRENIGKVIFGSVMVIAALVVIGWEFTLATLVVFALGIRFYTRRFYTPSATHLLEIQMEADKPVYINSYWVPSFIFDMVNTEGLVNQVVSNFNGSRHTLYIVKKIDWDPENPDIPVKIHFSWIHFPAHKFLLQKETYRIMVEFLNRLIVLNYKERELRDIHTWATVRAQTKSRLEAIGLGKTGGIPEITEEMDRLVDEIARFEKENDDIERNVSVSTSGEEENESEPEE